MAALHILEAVTTEGMALFLEKQLMIDFYVDLKMYSLDYFCILTIHACGWLWFGTCIL